MTFHFSNSLFYDAKKKGGGPLKKRKMKFAGKNRSLIYVKLPELSNKHLKWNNLGSQAGYSEKTLQQSFI